MLHTLAPRGRGLRLPAVSLVLFVLLVGFASLSTLTDALSPRAHAQSEPQAEAAEPLTQLSMSGEPGDYIGGGANHFYRPEDGTFNASGQDFTGDGLIDSVTIWFSGPEHWWFLDFNTNRLNKNLVPGFYDNAQRASFADPGHPGMDISGDGRGCNQVAGNFRVHEAVYDNTVSPPSVLRLTISFEQHCEGGPVALLGTIYYNSTADFPTFRISGRVAQASGAGTGGVQVVLSGSKTTSTTTDANGNYSFPGLLRGGHFRVTPAQSSDHIITPETTSVKNLIADRSVNFSSVPIYSISGQVRNASGSPITGVNVALSGSKSEMAFTDANGNYSFEGLRADGTYTVTPSRTFYSFSPPERTFNTLAADTDADFTGVVSTYTVSGRVIDTLGVGIGGVTVVLSGSRAAARQTDANGNYSFENLTAGGNYTFTPNAKHFTFSPPSHQFFGLSGNWGDINFIGFGATYAISGLVLDTSGNPLSNVVMHLSGSQTGTTVTDAAGNYSFKSLAAGGNYSVMPSRWDYVFNPVKRDAADLSADQALNFVGKVDSAGFFVRQHYLDFLNREPDAGGLSFWSRGITSCGTNQQCITVKRVDTSAAFFLSIEFQETGYLVYRFYKAAYGDATSPGVPGTVPVIRLEEFLPDTRRIGEGVVVGTPGWEAKLEANKRAFALEFVERPRFTAAFPASLTPAQFVDRLNSRAGGVLTAAQRSQLIQELTADNTAAGRAAVLRAVAENEALRRREFNRAFVLMQYYGYLRRNPDDGGNQNFGGWRFWLNKLEDFGGDYRAAEMVRAFIESIEYGARFNK